MPWLADRGCSRGQWTRSHVRGTAAVLVCPCCAARIPLRCRQYFVAEDGSVSPDVLCTAAGCGFLGHVVLCDWDEVPLIPQG